MSRPSGTKSVVFTPRRSSVCLSFMPLGLHQEIVCACLGIPPIEIWFSFLGKLIQSVFMSSFIITCYLREIQYVGGKLYILSPSANEQVLPFSLNNR